MLYGVFTPITALIVEQDCLNLEADMILVENATWCKYDIITTNKHHKLI